MSTSTIPTGLRVTQLERHPDGYLTARVHLNGQHADVDNKHGTWQTVQASADDDQIRKDVLPEVAAELQARLPKRERTVGR